MTKYVVSQSWAETPHLSPDLQAELAASYSPHELAARTRGIPQLGAGAIYPIQESEIVCEPFQLPVYYRHAYALDVGWQKTAALWGAQDPEADVIYLYSEHYQGEQLPIVHAEAVKSRGDWIPGVIDSAARGRSQADGQRLFDQYVQAGLQITAAQKLWKGTKPPVEAGIYDVWTGLSTGKIKVFSTLANLLGEFRIYRRDEKGHIVGTNDHLMDCLRYLVTCAVPLMTTRPRNQWDRMFPNRQAQNRNHTFDYNPMAEAWGESPRSSPWRRAS